MTYSKKLKDPKWQKKRLEILNRDDWKCKSCGDKEKTLHVHHTGYRGTDPWDTPDNMLITLCEDCHELESFSIRGYRTTLMESLEESGFLAMQYFDLAVAFSGTNINWRYWKNLEALRFVLHNQELWDGVLKKYEEHMEKVWQAQEEGVK